ncbi:aminotransferase class IV [Novosphingobium sp. TH158]|uniref:aminotransferase class IV n=1 Tax=Novosphingobium sp. TH158 TaxID=2067455 RepID=UPI000C7AE8C1|nr:aminotransferase class IV [Novosphingobium sp. TH158]PLK25657.1 D-amino acid aminotransferase [Novosphingobium sp. TH158]
MRSVWINGEWFPEAEAKVSVFDRGLLFSQSVYEVVPVIAGRLCNMAYHLARLARSQAVAGIADTTDWQAVFEEAVARNGVTEGRVYLQVTGGSAGDRDFLSPRPAPQPTRIVFTQSGAVVDHPQARSGLRIALKPDLRWNLRSAKTTQLLYAVLMKEEARAAGLDDAWLVEDGRVTEGTSSNAHIIDQRGVLISHPVDRGVLPGVTRICVMEIVRGMGLTVEERPFTPDELYAAREAFCSAASALVLPVVEVDGRTIGDGLPGELTRAIRAAYVERLLQA